MGDILKIENHQQAPADVLLLACSNAEDGSPPSGICYVETKNLDGETNLKLRQAHTSTYDQIFAPEDVAELKGRVDCGLPDADIGEKKSLCP